MTQPVGYVDKHAEYEKWLKDQQALHGRYRELVDMSNKYRQSQYGDYGGVDMMEVVDELPYISYEDYKNGVSWRDFAPEADFFNGKAYWRKEDGSFFDQVTDGTKGLGERASDGTIYSYIIADAHNAFDREWKEANPDLAQEQFWARARGRKDPNSPFYDPTRGKPPEEHADAQREAWGWSAAYGDANPETGEASYGPNSNVSVTGNTPPAGWSPTVNQRGGSTPFADAFMRSRGITGAAGPVDTVTNTEYRPDGVVYDELMPDGSGGIAGNRATGMMQYNGPFTPDQQGRAAGQPQTGSFPHQPNRLTPSEKRDFATDHLMNTYGLSRRGATDVIVSADKAYRNEIGYDQNIFENLGQEDLNSVFGRMLGGFQAPDPADFQRTRTTRAGEVLTQPMGRDLYRTEREALTQLGISRIPPLAESPAEILVGRPATGWFNPMSNQPTPTRVDPKPPFGRADGNAGDQRLSSPTPFADSYIRARQQAESRGPVSGLFQRFLKDD